MSILTETIEDVFEFDAIINMEYVESQIITINDIFEFDSIITTELTHNEYVPVLHTASIVDVLDINELTSFNALYNILINQQMLITQDVKFHAPAVVFTSRLGVTLDIKASDIIIIEHPPSSNRYTITKYYTFIVNGTVETIYNFKRFLDYHRSELIYIDTYTDVYEARLDYSDNTRRSMDMFRNDTQVTLNFYAIKIR